MKQMPLLQGKALLIELLEGAANPEIFGRSLTFDTPEADEWGYDYQAVKLPEGNWRIIGMLSEVREPEASKLVKYTGLGGYVDSYENYQNEGYLFLPTALESLESAILAEGWYFENPYLNPKNLKVDKNNPPFCLSDWYEQKLLEYETAESRVLDRSRCLLLGREG